MTWHNWGVHLVGVLVPAMVSAQAPASWTLSPEPLLRIEEGSTGTDFGRIADVRFRPDGSILVVSSQPTELRLFTSGGKFVGAIGKEGEGPGEYRAPRILLTAGDTIGVFDESIRRLTLFLSDGRSVATHRCLPVLALDRESP